jgi:hypothetical protein
MAYRHLNGELDIMRRKAYQIGTVAVLLLTFCMVSLANAEMTYYVTFEGQNFVDSLGSYSPPVDPVQGSFTITFDPAQNYANETTGITLNYLNINLNSDLAFTYYQSSKSLWVGGSENGAMTIAQSDSDFYLQIYDLTSLTTGPSFVYLAYTQGVIFHTWHAEVITGNASAVPLPPSILLMGSGLLSMALLGRRKRRFGRIK